MAWRCDVCKKRYDSRKEAEECERSCLNKKNKEKESLFQCDYCGKGYASRKEAKYCEKKHNENLEIFQTPSASYLGGHFLHPIHHKKEGGELTLNINELTFIKKGFFGKKWEIKIPLNKIVWEEVEQKIGEDKDYQNTMAATAYFAGGAPITSYNRKKTSFLIPYRESNGTKQSPIFSIENKKDMKKFSQILYKKIGENKKD